MVGGGWAFDDQQFPPRFHECGMIDVAGYAVTTAKAMSNGMVSPVPNRSDLKPGLQWKWVKDTYPDAIDATGGCTPTSPRRRSTTRATPRSSTGSAVSSSSSGSPTTPAGEANWAPFAQRLKDSGVEVMSFIGAPENLSQMLRSMQEIDYRPEVLILETNFYADVLINQAGSAAEGGSPARCSCRSTSGTARLRSTTT